MNVRMYTYITHALHHVLPDDMSETMSEYEYVRVITGKIPLSYL